MAHRSPGRFVKEPARPTQSGQGDACQSQMVCAIASDHNKPLSHYWIKACHHVGLYVSVCACVLATVCVGLYVSVCVCVHWRMCEVHSPLIIEWGSKYLQRCVHNVNYRFSRKELCRTCAIQAPRPLVNYSIVLVIRKNVCDWTA